MRKMQVNPSAYGVVMWTLTALFFLRVLGQALVAFLGARFLPRMETWYSGLISYPVLLPIQCVILIVMCKISSDFSTGRGFFVVPKKRMGHFLVWFSYIYFGSMAFRYVATMVLHPEQRWLGGAIPIFFHFVLAGFLFALGYFHVRRGGS